LLRPHTCARARACVRAARQEGGQRTQMVKSRALASTRKLVHAVVVVVVVVGVVVVVVVCLGADCGLVCNAGITRGTAGVATAGAAGRVGSGGTAAAGGDAEVSARWSEP